MIILLQVFHLYAEFHQNAKGSDFMRRRQILGHLCSRCPLSHFNWGHKGSLRVPLDVLRNQLLRFWRRFYTASLMNLVVQAHEDIHVIEVSNMSYMASIRWLPMCTFFHSESGKTFLIFYLCRLFINTCRKVSHILFLHSSDFSH